MENYIDDSRIHEGHRQRMKAKLLAHGQRIFDTYELLEMLLYHVIPYKDTNPIAKRLLAAFGGLEGVLNASTEELTTVSGVGARTAEFIRSVGELYWILGAEFVPKSEKYFDNDEDISEYIINYFKDETEQSVIIMLLDNNMRLIETKRIYNLDYSSAGIRPKLFLDAALSVGASAIISAHNHPFGAPCPSHGDRVTHSMISDALSQTGILHKEHYVVSGDSYSTLGSPSAFRPRLRQSPNIGKFIIMQPTMFRTFAENEKNEYPPLDARYNTRYFEYFASLLSVIYPKNSREMAHRLLSRYLTIENALCALESELVTNFSEKVAFFLKILAYISSRRRTDEFVPGRMYTKMEIMEYLSALFIGESVEKVYILTYDANGVFTGYELLGEGTINASEVMPRKAIEAAFKKSAKFVEIAHNHPLGKAAPSNEDLRFTNSFTGIFDVCDIKLTAHYIVAGQLCDTVVLGMKKGDE